ncbi:MAG: hypothetical protein RI949_258 [Pseudomonadota bacterium]|jgi:hypothetical protein
MDLIRIEQNGRDGYTEEIALPATSVSRVVRLYSHEKGVRDKYKVVLTDGDVMYTHSEPVTTEVVQARGLELWQVDILTGPHFKAPEVAWSRAPILSLPIERGIFHGSMHTMYPEKTALEHYTWGSKRHQYVLVDTVQMIACQLTADYWDSDLLETCRVAMLESAKEAGIEIPEGTEWRPQWLIKSTNAKDQTDGDQLPPSASTPTAADASAAAVEVGPGAKPNKARAS